MTPKEKSKELYYKIKSNLFSDTKNDAKRCALTAVDEILLSHSFALGGIKPSIYKYWQEVKEEIEKL